MIRKADDHRARVEAKLDQVLEALSNSNGAGSAESRGRGSVSDATAPRAKLEQGAAGPPAVAGRESDRRETSPPGVTAAGRGREIGDGGQGRATGGDSGGDDRPRRVSSGGDLDEFIDHYHAEASRER
ncbi:unnamed protein product [Ectocarpus sp. 13 AM-2016]